MGVEHFEPVVAWRNYRKSAQKFNMANLHWEVRNSVTARNAKPGYVLVDHQNQDGV
jgi:hypothetical protein